MTRATIPTADGPMSLEVAEPAGPRPAPGVLVVHDALGMTADLVAQTRWLAENGYLAVAPDLYHRGGRIRCMVATMRALAAGTGPVFEDLSATRDWITSREDCTGAVGVVGFCMGGNIALMVAASGDYDVSGVNYGDIEADRYEMLSGACPIVASYGGRDRSLRGTPQRLERALVDFGIDHDIETYSDAGHGFLNDHRGEMPLWALVAGWYAHTGYDPDAAEAARARILAFFGRHLAADEA